ncbi:MAG: TIR domain-containing protein [Rickettsiales bacterium]|nr:TIR domain-containing protein [Rickettsiales bacterium]
MALGKTYNIFISHCWDYSKDYDNLIGLLDQDSRRLNYRDYSIPKDDPIHTRSENVLLEAIENKIKMCSVIIVVSRVAITYQYWSKKEIEIAHKYNKPVLALKPLNADYQSTVAVEGADCEVSWRTDSIIEAIKQYGG